MWGWNRYLLRWRWMWRSRDFRDSLLWDWVPRRVEEARERVKTAIKNSGFDFPPKKITVNLAPADLPKVGVAYDLPIAIGILAASQQCPILNELDSIFYGELSLDGSLRATKG